MPPISTDNKLFLVILGIHVVAGLTCVISGAVAMLSNKTKRIHPKAGRVYYWGMVFVFVTALFLILEKSINVPILILDIAAFLFTFFGRRIIHMHNTNRTRLHTICMGLSYVLLLTGFYVDDGKNLPFWRQFSQLFFWTFPSVIGIPIIIYVLFRHPLNRSRGKGWW